MNDDIESLLTGQLFKKMAEQQFHPLMETYDLRKVELDILCFLADTDSQVTARDIMNRRYISKAHISKSIKNLKKRGLIHVREDVDDRRLLHISITADAMPIIAAYRESWKQISQILFDGITAEEKEMILNVLHRIVHNLDQAIDHTE